MTADGTTRRFALECLLLAFVLAASGLAGHQGGAAAAEPLATAGSDTAQGRNLVERLRAGGLVLFFRHADTVGEPCDRSFKVGDREGQRNISPRGREQSRRIGAAMRDLAIPYDRPVLAGPVFRARDTAELAFGPSEVEVTDSLLADDFSGARLRWVLAEHQRLFNAAVPDGTNRILVGHRTPAIMVLGPAVGGRAFPEGSALMLRPRRDADLPEVLGILMLAPIAGGGFHGC